MYRIEFTKNVFVKKQKTSTVRLLKNDYNALVHFASCKFKINKRKIRLFVCRNSSTAEPGTEITLDSDLDHILCDGVLIAVSKGEDYLGKNNKISNTKVVEKYTKMFEKMRKPPRWPYPGNCCIKNTSEKNLVVSLAPKVPSDVKQKDHIMSDIELSNAIQKTVLKPTCNVKLPFPILKGDVLKVIRKAIKSFPKITETSHVDGYISFDYRDNVVFPKMDNFENGVIRECRGLIISPKTGQVMARRFHKFFNIDECAESKLENINFTGARVFEKLDGRLVSPILLDDGKLIWATRRSRCKQVENFATESYNNFATRCLKQNKTPLFEWCVSDYTPR